MPMLRRTALLATGMLISGVCNTILNKLQDMTCVENCDDSPNSKKFEQPVFQTFNMFVGEVLCFLWFYTLLTWKYQRAKAQYVPLTSDIPEEDTIVIEEDNEESTDTKVEEQLTGWRVYLFSLPAFCDICATTLMNVGLIYTTASVYQMVRGVVVLFTGSFSVLFLRRRLYAYHWFSLSLVVLGVSIVGVSSVFSPSNQSEKKVDSPVDSTDNESLKATIGVFLVLVAQIFTAGQFVIEEKIMERYHVNPLRAVGLEGIFGLSTVTISAIILHFTIGIHNPDGYFNISTGLRQVFSFQQIWITGIAICFSIAFFNFFGLAVTRTLSATSRSTIDTSRIVLVWLVSLFLGWEGFSWLQVAGFIVLVLGTFIFNNVIRPPPCFTVPPSNVQESEPLLSE